MRISLSLSVVALTGLILSFGAEESSARVNGAAPVEAREIAPSRASGVVLPALKGLLRRIGLRAGTDTRLDCPKGQVPLARRRGCGPRREFRWIPLPAGSMTERWTEPEGSSIGDIVSVGAFELARTPTTVGEYRACVAAGVCTPPKGNYFEGESHPDEGDYLNWDAQGREDHPINGVTWYQAQQFCAWIGGRLPTGVEWEYAARSAGREQPYPWGDEPLGCDRVVMNPTVNRESMSQHGCGEDSTWPVCSKPAGDSRQGVCDLLGNVYEWHADEVKWGFPIEADREPDTRPQRVTGRGARGGCWDCEAIFFGLSDRYGCPPDWAEDSLGFRCARTPD